MHPFRIQAAIANVQSLLSPFFCLYVLLEVRLRKGEVDLAAFFGFTVVF